MNCLIAYFSRRGENYVNGAIRMLTMGNTERVANQIAVLTGGTLFEIVRAQPYADTYADCVREAREEMQADARPELATEVPDMAQYDTILLGYPSWCSTMPMPVKSFLAGADTVGKTILPFCTNEGSGMGRSESDLKTLCPEATVKMGLSVRGSSVDKAETEIRHWLEHAGVLDAE